MRLAVALVALLLGVVPALATGGEAVEMRDGPGKNARDLEPFWMMRCGNGTRLVGLRVHADRHIAGVEALCAGLKRDDGEVSWLSKPRVWTAPPVPAPVRRAPPPERAVGTVLRAESGGVMRYRGSRAIVISVPREEEKRRGAPAPDARYVLPFESTRKSTDLVCPIGTFVEGLRTGAAKNELAAIQLICGDGGAGTALAIGDWPALRKKDRPLTVQRIQCGGGSANPLDGDAANAVFGTIAAGRVQSLGLTCARLAAAD